MELKRPSTAWTAWIIRDAILAFWAAVSLRTQRALLSLLRGRPANAIADLETAIELDPEATRAATMLALTELRLGNYQSALRAATVLLDRGEDNPFAHNLAGGAHLGLGDIAAGRAAFERALTIDPDYWPAVDNLANHDMAAGDIEAAQRRYVEALERDDKLIGAMIALAKLADAAGESAEAIRWLEKERSTDRSLADELAPLVALYGATGQPEEAVSVATALRERDPTSLILLEALGRAQMAVGETAQTVDTLGRMVEVVFEERSAEWLFHISRLQLAAADAEGAEDALSKALDIDRYYLPALVGMVELESARGRIEQALKRTRRLRITHPTKISAVDTLFGDVLMRAG